MEKTKLLQLLNCLSAWELRNLGQFLRSPFHNQRDDVVRLFKFYREQRDKRKPDFSDKAAIHAVWPDMSRSNAEYPNLRSYLYKLVEKYLAIEEIMGDEFLLKMYLAKAYGRLNKADNFGQTVRDLKNILEKQPLRNTEHLRRQFELEYELLDYDISRGDIKEDKLRQVSDMLDSHYFAEKLKLACAQTSFLYVRPDSFDIDQLHETVDFVKETINPTSHPAINMYYLAYRALSDEHGKEHFTKIRHLLSNSGQQFTARELGDVCRICLNYCIRRANQGDLAYANEGLILYSFGIEHGYLLKEGHLPYHTYINAAAFGISLGEFEWVERFIEDYKNKITLGQRENAYLFSLSRLRYAQGEYHQAMPLLAKFVTDYPYHFLIAQKMLCKIYFELKEITPLESLLGSMVNYLHRHKMDTAMKAHFKLFVSLLSRLVKLTPGNEKAKCKLKSEAEKLPLKIDQNWFLKHLD
ncbi:MAG: hypothetical protein KIS77_18520 [Saprospiraceae bacterium]|nr:hypothetical protein [Saprospiraceae bacterium]